MPSSVSSIASISEDSESDIDDVGDGWVYRSFLRGLKKHNSNYADFTIKRGNRSWRVHKLVISSQSEYFARACSGEFSEAQSNTLTLNEEDDDEGAISTMIHFLYHFDYQVDTSEDAPMAILQDIRLFLAADKYLVQPLRKLALKNIRSRLRTEWNTEAFSAAIREIYTLFPTQKDMLKPEIIKILKRHRELLQNTDAIYGALESALRELGEFAADAAIALAEPMLGRYRAQAFKCPSCDTTFCVPIYKASFAAPSDVTAISGVFLVRAK